MGKRIKPRDKIVQRSIGFSFRQIEFFNNNPEFRPDKYCRDIIDQQIRELGQTEYLKIDCKEENNEKTN